MKTPYMFSALRYVDDVVLGEFVNVSVPSIHRMPVFSVSAV